MRACAFDYGTVRVGVAVVDELGLLAHPRPALPGRDRAALLQAICELVRDESIEHIVVGLPLDMKGTESGSAKAVRVFATEIANATGLSVELWDERLSTTQAHRAMAEHTTTRQRKTRVDSAAACIVLQAWLEAQRGRR